MQEESEGKPRLFSIKWFANILSVVKIWKYSMREHAIAMLSTQITLAQLAFGGKLLSLVPASFVSFVQTAVIKVVSFFTAVVLVLKTSAIG